MVFHIFGDSHAEFAWSKISNVKPHPLYSTLCYSIGRDQLERLNIAKEEYNVKENDSVCFLFGEIDCSCHVHKYITDTHSYKDEINLIVESYFKTIEINVKQFSSLRIYVCSIPPAVIQSTVSHAPDETGKTWLQHRFLGSDEERKEYVKYFNSTLEEYSKKYNYTFIDIHDFYTDENGFLNRKYSCPSVHIQDPIFIEKYCKDHNILLDQA